MSNWTQSEAEPGFLSKTLHIGNVTVTLHRPVLKAEERSKREARAREELERGMRDYIRRKESTP